MSDYVQRLKAISGVGPKLGHVIGLPSDFFPGQLWTPPSGAAAPPESAADGGFAKIPQVIRADGHERRRAYRVNDAARLLSISRSTVYKMASLGTLKLISIGGRTLVSHDEIERLLSAGDK